MINEVAFGDEIKLSDYLDKHKLVVADIESDGLLEDITKIHCIASSVYGVPDIRLDVGKEFNSLLTEFDKDPNIIRVFHNGIGFDEPAIAKVTKRHLGPEGTLDTMVLSRLCYSDMAARDKKNLARTPRPYYLPNNLIGRHSLEAWGWRLGVNKGQYDGDWSEYTEEMGEYCKQDVRSTYALLRLLLTKKVSLFAYSLEHRFQKALVGIMSRGVLYDQESADAFEMELTLRLAEIDDELARTIDPFVKTWETEVKALKRSKLIPFNAASPKHRVRHFQERHGWVPTTFTEGGGPKMDAEVLSGLDYPEAKLLKERAQTAKILGYLSTGKMPWKHCVEDDGRIRGYINNIGTVTHRCSHSSPNLGNIPKKGSLGQRCRKLFIVGSGRKLIGCDAKGLELRMLAEALYPYDGGSYWATILKGDIHSANQAAAGLDERDQAKTFIYAWLYGAGVEKLGRIVKGGASEGKRLKSAFLANTPGIADWIDDMKFKASRDGCVYGMDGRRVSLPYKRSERTGELELCTYVAPNYKLQTDGAIVMKQFVVNLDEALIEHELDAGIVLDVHDEVQVDVLDDPHTIKTCQELMLASMINAGKVFNLHGPLEGDCAVGDNWMETH